MLIAVYAHHQVHQPSHHLRIHQIIVETWLLQPQAFEFPPAALSQLVRSGGRVEEVTMGPNGHPFSPTAFSFPYGVVFWRV
jgi:hypothetical protein